MINRSTSVADYKRSTLQGSKPDKSPTMASEQQTAPTPAEAPAAEAPAPVKVEAPSAAPDFGSLFESMCNNLSEDERKVAIEGQNHLFKELENVHAQLDEMKKSGNSEAKAQIEKLQGELEETKKKNGNMQQMYVDNVKATMQAIKNFYAQDGESPNVTGAPAGAPDYAALEGALQEHPELSRQVLPIFSCAFSRVGQLQESLKVHQQEQTRSAEERDLFARMRGFQRDSAKPTCKPRQFDFVPPVTNSIRIIFHRRLPRL